MIEYLSGNCQSHLSTEFGPIALVRGQGAPQDVVSIDVRRPGLAAPAGGLPPLAVVRGSRVAADRVVALGGRLGTRRRGLAVLAEAEHGAESFQQESRCVGVLLLALARLALVAERRLVAVDRLERLVRVRELLVHCNC